MNRTDNVVPIAGHEPWVTKTDLALILAVSERWIELRMHDADPLPHRKRGRAVRFRVSEVDEWEQRMSA